MFKRVFVEEWAQIIPIISFCIFSVVFLVVSIRAMRLRKPERERMASLPLDQPSNPDFSNISTHQDQ